MKAIFKFLVILIAFGLVYYAGSQAIQYALPEHQSTADSSLLLIYGGMTGYILAIVFVVLLQKPNYDELKRHKPRFGKLLQWFHVFIALVFISYAIVSFNIEFAVLMVLIFLFVTTILDYIREKIIQENDGGSRFPKKIL